MPLDPPYPPSVPFQTVWDALVAYIDSQVAAGGGGTSSTALAADALLHMVETTFPGDVAPTSQDTGLWYRNTRVRPPSNRTRLANFYTTTDVTTGVTGTTADPAPNHPNGAILITAPGTTRRLPQKNLGTTVDLSRKNLRIPIKLTSKVTATGVTDPQFLFRCRVEVSSDNFAGSDGTVSGANRSYITMQPQNTYLSIFDIWQTFTGGPGEWRTVGTGANLAAVNSIRFHLENNSSTVTSTLSVSHVDTFDLAPKAKCCLCFDDYYISDNDQHWDTMGPKMMSRNFVGTMYPNIAMFQAGDVERLRSLQALGWQVASHAWTNSEHAALTGNTLVKSLMRSRQRHKGLGFGSGGEDFAWWGGLAHTAANHDALRPYFRSGRLFTSPNSSLVTGGVHCETLPPGNPLRLRGYGTAGSDITDVGVTMKAYIDKAITSRGLAVITWHNTVFGAEFDALLDYLDAKRADIDVVTMEQALSPYLADSPDGAVTSNEITSIRQMTAAQYAALSVKDSRTLYVVT